uniref:Bindin n=3 Tax=Echinometra lucunter TaxID=105361 RepID=Q6SQJ4_ECHLU|nr:bindin precursor [Echinometra lucunter]
MGVHQISVIIVIVAFTFTRAVDDFPSRTDVPSDCPEASSGCWCHDSFAQCWRTYDDSHVTSAMGNRITQLELLYQTSEEVVTYIRGMSALRKLRISEDGVSLDCSCDIIYALDDERVTLIDQNELVFGNCREHGFPLDRMTARPFINHCHILRMQDAETRKRRDADDEDDDVSKRASPRKGDKPAGHKINLKDLDPSSPTKVHHLVSTDDADQLKHHPASDIVNFISRHRRNRRSAATGDEVSDDSERGGRQKRYGNYPQAMNPPMGGGNYPAPGQAPMGQLAQQGYAAPGMGGPVGGGGAMASPIGGGGAMARPVGFGGAMARPVGGGGAMARPVGGGGAMARPVGGGGAMARPVGGGRAGPPGYGGISQAAGGNDEDYSSSSDEEETTISAKVMDNIKAVLGATKIDLPVDINDPYDLGLLLRHLRHHSNLLANIGDPEVREQVLSAMQEEEEEEEEEQDAANGVRDNVLSNLNANGPYRAGFGGGGGGMHAGGGGGGGGGRGGMGVVGGRGGGGGMMGFPGMGGQGNAYNPGYRQG